MCDGVCVAAYMQRLCVCTAEAVYVGDSCRRLSCEHSGFDCGFAGLRGGVVNLPSEDDDMGPDGKKLRPGISSKIIEELTDCNAALSQQRKRRQISSSLALVDAVERYTQLNSYPLHKTNKPRILSVDIHNFKLKKLIWILLLWISTIYLLLFVLVLNLQSSPRKSVSKISKSFFFLELYYMNRPNVQEALYANVARLDHDWESCSGDTYGRIPATSTKYSIEAMKLKLKTPWVLTGWQVYTSI